MPDLDDDVAPPLGIGLRAMYDGDYSLPNLLRLADLADRLGYDSVWLAESWGTDAISLLSTIATRTRRIRVGTAVLSVFARSAGTVAMTAATMADLHTGRFVLGLGTGTGALSRGWHGIEFDRPLDRLTDYVAVVRQALTGDVVAHAGPTVQVNGFRLRTAPENSDLPIYIAGLGPRARRMAGREGDGWLPYLVPRAALPRLAEQVRAAAAARRPTIAPLLTTSIGEDRDTARDQARAHLAFYLGAMGPHYREFVASNGFPELPDRIADAWRRMDRELARSLVTDEMLAELAVCGQPDDAREQLASWRAAGADLPILQFTGTTPATDVEFALTALAPAPTMPAE